MGEHSNSKPGALALVTGASGFIGRALCDLLLQQGCRVRAFLRATSTGASLPAEVETCYGELNSEQDLLGACEGVEVVYHLAGIAHVNVDTADYERVNVAASQALLDACLAVGSQRLVFFSSILAAQAERETITASAYAKSKRQAEELFLQASSANFQPVILRPVNVYGPGMKGNIAGLIRRIQGGALPPLPRLENQLSLVSVQDLCAAALLAAENPVAGGQIYPVTDGLAYTPNTLESAIYAALERKKPGWHSPRMLFYAASLVAQMLNGIGVWNNDLGLRTYRNLVESNQASCEKITTELGYRPTRNFADELPAILSALQ